MTAPEWPWGDWGPGVTLGSVVESGEKATELDFCLPPPGDLPAPVGAAENRGSRKRDVRARWRRSAGGTQAPWG